jgi:hypothetical protein
MHYKNIWDKLPEYFFNMQFIAPNNFEFQKNQIHNHPMFVP